MRVAIDYRPARTHPPGVGRYLRELVRALARLDTRPDLLLVELGGERSCYSNAELGLAPWPERVEHVRLRAPRRALELVRHLGFGVDRLRRDVALVHQSRTPPMPVHGAREVLSIAEWPQRESAAERRLIERLRRAAGVQVFSRAGAELVLARSAIEPARVRQVAVGCEHWRRDLGRPLEPALTPQIVTLGRIEHQVGALAALRALEELRERGIDANWRIVAPRAARGPKPAAVSAFEAALERSPARSAVRWEPPAGAIEIDPGVHERALPELVARSSVLLHLVGTALTPVTPLEALALALPVVVTRLPAFEEALGATAEFVELEALLPERSDPGSLTDALARAIGARRDETAIELRTRTAREFSWRRCALETIEAWNEAVSAVGGARPPRAR